MAGIDPSIPLQTITTQPNPIDSVAKWQDLANAGVKRDVMNQQIQQSEAETANLTAQNPGMAADSQTKALAAAQAQREMDARKTLSKYYAANTNKDGTIDYQAAEDQALKDGADISTIFSLRKAGADATSQQIKSKDDAVKFVTGLGEKAANQLRGLDPNNPNDVRTALGIAHGTNQIASGVVGPGVAKSVLDSQFGLDTLPPNVDANGQPVMGPDGQPQRSPEQVASTIIGRSKQIATSTISPQQEITNKLNQGNLAVNQGNLSVSQARMAHDLSTSYDTPEGKDPNSVVSQNAREFARSLGLSVSDLDTAFTVKNMPGYEDKLKAAGTAAVNPNRGAQFGQGIDLKAQAAVYQQGLDKLAQMKKDGVVDSTTTFGTIIDNLGSKYNGGQEAAAIRTWRDNYNNAHPNEKITDATPWGTIEGKFEAEKNTLLTTAGGKTNASQTAELPVVPSSNNRNVPKTGTVNMRNPKTNRTFDVPVNEVDEARRSGFEFVR